MKKWLILLTFIAITLFFSPIFAMAQTNTESGYTARAALSEGESRLDHTGREEQEGKGVWEKLQAKQLECKGLTDNQYGSLGEYFMGQSIGDTQRHEAMNQMMISMMGEEGEEQMHIAMGKRLSGCDPNAQVPSSGVGFMPMMWMVKGGGNPMMGWGFGILGWLFMIIFWVLIILGVVALIRYLSSSGKSGDKEKTPLEILKERYARGEIDKKEFEEKKKDL